MLQSAQTLLFSIDASYFALSALPKKSIHLPRALPWAITFRAFGAEIRSFHIYVKTSGDRAAMADPGSALIHPAAAELVSLSQPTHVLTRRQDFGLRRFRAIEHSEDRSAVDDRRPVAHSQNLRQLRRDHHDGGTLRSQLSHQRMNFCLRSNVNPLCGLVQDQHRRPGNQPAAQCNLLLIAAREVGDRREN